MSIETFELFQEKYNATGAKLDYYYVLDDLSVTRIRNIYKVIQLNNFRAIATFSENIKHLDELPCKKIALINYPKAGMSASKILREIESVKADEIEFPWDKKYMQNKEEWRNIVLKALSQGKIIRPMLEFGIDTPETIKDAVDFFKEIGIKDVVTSSGLIEESTTMAKFTELKMLFPNIFKIKVNAEIKDVEKAKIFLKEGASIVGTTFTKINITI